MNNKVHGNLSNSQTQMEFIHQALQNPGLSATQQQHSTPPPTPPFQHAQTPPVPRQPFPPQGTNFQHYSPSPCLLINHVHFTGNRPILVVAVAVLVVMDKVYAAVFNAHHMPPKCHETLTMATNTISETDNPAFSNPYKRFNKNNDRWTHGYDIHDDSHTSASCQQPAPGHVFQAKRFNTYGGSTKKTT